MYVRICHINSLLIFTLSEYSKSNGVLVNFGRDINIDLFSLKCIINIRFINTFKLKRLVYYVT